MDLLQKILDYANAEQRCVINHASPTDKGNMLLIAETLDNYTYKELANWASEYILYVQAYRRVINKL
jgi:hypothetical protein